MNAQPVPDRVAAETAVAMTAAVLTADSAENAAEKSIRNAGNVHPVTKRTEKHRNAAEMISRKEDLSVGMKTVLQNAAEMISRREDLSAEMTDRADGKTVKRSRSGKSSGRENLPMIEKKRVQLPVEPRFLFTEPFPAEKYT